MKDGKKRRRLKRLLWCLFLTLIGVWATVDWWYPAERSNAAIAGGEKQEEHCDSERRIAWLRLAVLLAAPVGLALIIKRVRRKKRPNKAALKIIRNSRYFDAEWYSHYYYDVLERGVDPAEDFCRYGARGVRNPGPEFCANEYLLLHPDVAAAGMNPLLHYELHGCRERRCITLSHMKDCVFPKEAEDVTVRFRRREGRQHGRIGVLASFFGDGQVDDYVLYLAQGIKRICDYVIFVADNPIYPDEARKLEDVCDVCICKRHGEYDFGSYKRGYQYAVEEKLLDDGDELLFVNDSCYGPAHPFERVVEVFREKNTDFYGLTISTTPQDHLQSFFYIFSPRVYRSDVFKNFLQSVKAQISPANVVYKYEMQFTKCLADAGFSYSSFVDREWYRKHGFGKLIIPTKYTKTLLKHHQYPLVKIKVLQGSSAESPEETVALVKSDFPELYAHMQNHLEKRLRAMKAVSDTPPAITHRSLYRQYEETLQKVRSRVRKGEKVRVQYLVNMPSMFPAKRLMEQMLQDDTFAVELYVIPDIRFGDEEMLRILKATYAELAARYPFVKYAVDFDETGITVYHNVSEGADLVCYPSPYDVSYSLYNPYYAVRNGLLSFHINYGFFRSGYDRIVYRMDNYNNFWKVFLETEQNLQEYKTYGNSLGYNAEVVGYAKMDGLQEYMAACPKNRERKKIIVAPHHSVEGGANHVLALSNFVQYADFFLNLFAEHPNVDFIFRPHPVLFTILSRPKQWGENKVKAYLARLAALPNVRYSTGGDYLQEFAESDGIIQDCGSFLVEYFYTGKPCCYMLKSPEDIENKFSELGKQCLENCYVAYDKDAIRQFLEEVILKGNDPKSEARARFAREVVMMNYPHVTEKILESLESAFMVDDVTNKL